MRDKKSTDLRIQRTEDALHTALQELMNEKPYEKIRVGEITKRARVSRQTFYLHYEAKDDLLISLFDDVFLGFRAELREKLSQNNVDFEGLGLLMFSYWGKKADIIRIFLDTGVENKFLKRIHTIFMELDEEIRMVEDIALSPIIPYVIHFVTGGTFMVLKHWIQEDMPISPERFGLVFDKVMAQFRETLRNGG
jgi:AcrR family transcriptional regulator